MFLLLLLASAVAPSSIPPPPTCNHLKYAYSLRGVPESDIPGRPISGSMLQICPSGPSCCTKSVEEKLGAWSEKQYRDALFNKTTSMAAELDQKATQVDDYIYVLLNKAQREFHEMFTRTYGVMYQKNADVFQEYFQDLKIYYDKGTLNPADSTSSFFNTLYQKMFKVLNAQYTFDGLYLSCVSENMDQLRPFGDVPRKLASAVKRSLVAARALVRALRTGHEIANQMTKVEPSKECLSAVQKMSSCPACQGLPEVKPCNGYCINIMKGCMAYHYEIDELWNKYIESLMSLSERLVGPFNVEMTIEPISIKISDAIMNFQESGFQVTQKVFELCGTPRLGRREARPQTSQFVFEKRLEKSHRPPARPQKSEFERMLIELKKKLKGAEGFWSLMPYQMCDTQMEKPYRNVKDKDSCWNGKESGSYAAKVVEDGLASQMQNPEVPVKIDLTHTLLNEQKFKLTNLANVLKSAYRGQDIEWWDEEDDTETQKDEGSGSDYYGEYTDDEDGFYGSGDIDDSEGSGESDDEIIVPFLTEPKENDKWNPWPKFPTTTTTTTTTVKPVTGGTSSVHLRSKWTLAKAVITYMLPVATCYFGGFLVDTPWIFQ